MKFIYTIAFLSALSAQAAPQRPSVEGPSCLTEIISQQETFRRAQGAYTNNINNLFLQNIKNCQGLRPAIIAASEDKFLVKMMKDGPVLSVNPSRKIARVK